MQTVEQRHRDAAADAWPEGGTIRLLRIRDGNMDNHPLVQAFARFEASLPPSAPPTDSVREALKRAPSEERLTEIVRTFNYKYFGDYEMSEDQRAAVDDAELAINAVRAARAALALPPSGIAEMVREICAKAVDAERELRGAHYAAAKAAGKKGEARDFETMVIAHSQSASAIRSLDLSNKGVG